MRQKIILITGANGEVGHGLIRQLAEMGGTNGKFTVQCCASRSKEIERSTLLNLPGE